MFGPGVHLSGFVLVCESEHGVRDAQVVFSADAQEQQIVAVQITHSMHFPP